MVHGCLAVLERIARLTAAAAQFIIATHTSVLFALPEALICRSAVTAGSRRSDSTTPNRSP
ncbi:MAG TPA: hypothetical protein DGG94_03045 [Micromonosporaceae bacterium]|nr:hypothetical protein [Micromonosporaceae bacterium]